MDEEIVILFVVVILVGGAVALMITSMNNRRRLREMAHRERLAMIERGLIPAPEVDPAGFDAATRRAPAPNPTRRGDRYRAAGVGMIGVGMAFLVLIGATGDGDVALGVGGAWVMLGAALLVNYYLMNSGAQPSTTTWTPPRAKDTHPPADLSQ